jgi:hypothetical protein
MRNGNPAASSCARKIVCRTPWIDTRSKVHHRRQCADNIEFTRAPDLMDANALSLPLDGDQRLRPPMFHPIGAPTARRRCFGARAGTAGSGSLARRSFAALPPPHARRFPRAVEPHNVSWVASPARNMQPIGSDKTLREGWPPGMEADIAPSTNGAAFQRGAGFLDGGRCFAAEQLCQPFEAEGDHRLFPCAEIAAERACDIDRAQGRRSRIGGTEAPCASSCSAR